MNKLAKEINSLLLENPTIKEYLCLKKEIENDNELVNRYNELQVLRKEICKDKQKDSSAYYSLLENYKNDARIKRYEMLKREIQEYFIEISDILTLK